MTSSDGYNDLDYGHTNQAQSIEFNPTNNDIKKAPKKGKLLFPPFIMLLIFSFINLLAYFDRGALSALLEDISTNLKVSDSQNGLLGSIFMVGYMLGSPFMAHLVHSIEPFFVFSLGLAAWCGSVCLCGLSGSFFPLLIGRLFTGLGESGFLIIAPPLIDRLAPSSQKSLWLSIFYTAIPVGYALGFALSGVILDAGFFGNNTWRAIFIGEGLLMAPFVIFGLFNRSPFSFGGHGPSRFTDEELSPSTDYTNNNTYLPPASSHDLDDLNNNNNSNDGLLSNNPMMVEESNVSVNSYNTYDDNEYGHNSHHTSSDHDYSSSSSPHKRRTCYELLRSNPLGKRLLALFLNPLFLTAVLGYAAQTFVTGGFAFYGITYARKVFKVSKTTAGAVFGGVTIVSGILGTLIGGIWLDKWRRGAEIPSSIDGTTKVQEIIDSNPRTKEMTTDELEDYKAAIIAKLQDLHNPNTVKDRLQSIELGLRLVIIATTIAIPFALACFLVSNIKLFAALIFVAELALFCCLSVLNSCIIWCVPFNLSPQSIAFSVVIVHALGDALSPLIMGFLIEATNKSYRSVMIICCLPLALAVFSWSIGNGKIINYLNSIKYYHYKDHPTYITDSNTRDSYGVVDDNTYEELQPFVRLRAKLYWPLAESCH